ncbi:MAG: NINE protein [Bacteroidota bacterium]
MKSRSTAFWLTVVGFFGLAGLQHFYLGKIVKGVIWLLTGGLFFVGTIYDLFTIGGQTDTVNYRTITDISNSNEQLERLFQLKQSGAITTEEFEIQKAKLLL